ncbi:hypothetical protein GXP67_13910 [Rhodocytophaga rosea]|uniref:Uncharacterized protein n=1 Tax=Rhodocytophaga rosea TaxID=2704465 RepID=A0A6C0GIB0_9BACT|nr:hypothetical protein [Rhodocytophaga rosea]QHT67645.1 hypothetical protein GXP67_13910 [Rhodocytophaga rosea]
MIEVFKTNVESRDQASILVEQINSAFPGYKANFDLEDCDKILRVVCTSESIEASLIINLLKTSGWTAQVLEDDIPSWPFVWANELSFDRLK